MRPPNGGRRLTAAAIENQQYVLERERQVTRRELAAAGRDAMKGLVLRPALRLILAELIGCWSEKMVRERILVWPSNDYLVRRTGLPERSLRYGIRQLVEHGLIVPKDSANGKRFAIKTRAGELVDVYGFDLTPLYARRGEWVTLIASQDAQREARARLFDEITIHRRAVEEALSALPSASDLVDELEELRGRTPRRSLTAGAELLVPIVKRWRMLRAQAEEAFYQAASGGNLRRHIETKPIESKNDRLEQVVADGTVREENPSPNSHAAPVDLVVVACPSILDFVEQPKSEVDLVAAGRYLRSSLGAHATVWDEAVEALGPVNAAITVCLVLQLYSEDTASGAPKIRNPGGYLRSMVRMVADRRINLRAELLTLIRRRNGKDAP